MAILYIFLFNCLVYLAFCTENRDSSVNIGKRKRKVKCRRNILSEIKQLRQLVNQESILRQELERQVQEFQQQMINGNTPIGIKYGSCNSNVSFVMNDVEKGIKRLNVKLTHIEKNLNEHFTDSKTMFAEMFLNITMSFKNVKNSLENRHVQQNASLNVTKSFTRSHDKETNPGRDVTRKHCTGHTGDRFQIMVPPGNNDLDILLIISTDSNTRITMRSSYPDLSREFNVIPPGTNMSLPADFALNISLELQPRGLTLESTECVSVYIFHEDGFTVPPARHLDFHYQQFSIMSFNCFISVMPYGGNAAVKFTSTNGIHKHFVIIPEHEVYLVSSVECFEKVTISSNQTIAVISGHFESVSFHKDQSIFDSVMPNKAWGMSYIIPYIPYASYRQDFLFSSSSNGLYSNSTVNTKSFGYVDELYTHIISETSYFLQSVHGTLAVVVSLSGRKVFNSFICVVPSISHFSNNYRFWTPFYTENNFLAVIINGENTDGILLDEVPITDPFISHTVATSGIMKYKILTIGISHGWHTVRHDDSSVRFGLIMYGGETISYGLSLGFRLI